MHPLIKNYVEISNFPIAKWDEYLSKANLLEAAIINLKDNLNNYVRSSKVDEEEIDNALMVGHEDADIFLIFISFSIICLSQTKQFEKAKSLVSIGENLISTKIQPEIHSLFLQVHSRLMLYCGEGKEEKRLLAESLQLLKRDSPRYRANLTNYAHMLARQGMLCDLNPLDEKVLNFNDDPNKSRMHIFFETYMVNSIMQGDFVKGFELLKATREAYDFVGGVRYDYASASINILNGNREITSYKEEVKPIAILFEDFYECRYESIVGKLNLIQGYEFKPYIYLITKYLPLHYELSIKNFGKAKFILKEKLKTGLDHFLDDLFYARIALLENKKNEALFFFKRLMLNVQKYEFDRRLAFELQFAKELSASDLYFLLQKVNEFKGEHISIEDPINLTAINTRKGLDLIVGKSNSLEKVKKLIIKFSSITEPVLVTGETGTGKELVAQAIHDIGPNAKEPFLAINCGSLTDTLLQSELFGYEAGAFTGAQKEKKGIFEAAGSGTVFLDEFEDVSPKMQSSLLRVLESNEIRLIGGIKSRKIQCKLVIATNKPLKKLVATKIFREDLYFRLARFEIKLPTLKERKEDIPQLIQHFLFNPKQDENSPAISKDLYDKLSDYSWPGNIRELRNAVERMKVLHSDKKIFGVDEFDFDQLENFPKSNEMLNVISQKTNSTSTPIDTIESLEDERIKKIMNESTKIGSRQQLLRTIFLNYKKVTRRQVMEILKVSPLTAANALHALSDSGFIVKQTPTKSTKSHYYELKQR